MKYRSQCVRVNGALSEKLYSSTGSPQRCVLSPLLHILYTNSGRSQFDRRQVIKFADDSVIISLLKGGELDHDPVVNYFVTWCKESYLEFNVSAPTPKPTERGRLEVEVVESYKYLWRTVLDNKLRFQTNAEAIHKKMMICNPVIICLMYTLFVYFTWLLFVSVKCHWVTWKALINKMYYYYYLRSNNRKMNMFNVCTKMMTLIYKSFIGSVLSFSVIVWFGNLNLAEQNKMGRFVGVAGEVIGVRLIRPSCS